MRILGIDPGYGRLGWSVIDHNLTLMDFGVIETDGGNGLDERLLGIHRILMAVIAEHQPDTAAMEKIYFARNTTTALDVAKAIGVVILSLKLSGIGYYEYTPSQIKHALTGYGRATKDQMQKMIKIVFQLAEIPQPDDAADALAVAACHSFSLGTTTRR